MSSDDFNILFTCVGRRVGLLRAFRESMDALGLTGLLIGTDVTMAAAGMHVVDVAEVAPAVSRPEYLEHLRELVGRYRPRLLVPLTDLDLLALSRQREAFAALGCAVMIAPPAVMEQCRDKIRFNDLLARAGLAGIRTLPLRQFQLEPFYPCFIKPVDGSASIGTARIADRSALTAHVATFGENLLVQEYIPGQEYTVDVYVRRDGEPCAIVPRQRLSVRSGEVEKAITVRDQGLIDAAGQLVRGMPGLWGVINAQCRRGDDNVPRFFEANLRFGGGATLSLAAGVNLPRMLLEELLGQRPRPRIGQFTDRLLMLRYDEAVYTTVSNPDQLPLDREPTAK